MRDLHQESNPSVQQGWDWPIFQTHQNHAERVALLRPIPYELSLPHGDVGAKVLYGRALSLNISSWGMLILMDQEPVLDQVMKVLVPTPIALAERLRWRKCVGREDCHFLRRKERHRSS